MRRVTANGSLGGKEKIWIAPQLARWMEPLLAGLGIDFEDRANATLRIEASAADCRGGPASARITIEHGGELSTPTGNESPMLAAAPLAFETSGVWSAASYAVSRAFAIDPPLLTGDSAMFAVMRAAARAGQIDSPVLVTAETGTGKELLVRLIHAASGRAGGMYSVNCAALNETARVTEPVPPSADRAPATRPPSGEAMRLEETANEPDATLFLDQVSELSAAAQARVLHTIVQATEAPRDQPRRGARLVSATNRPLGPMVLGGQFKRELHERIAVLTLGVPPLRERRGDVTLLAADFLRAAAPHLHFTAGALKALCAYPFPGNVRELHNLVTRLAILQRQGAGQLIHASEVRLELVGASSIPSIWKLSSSRMRREMAMQALSACGGDPSAAARRLGITVRALQQHVPAGSRPPTPRSR